MEEENIKKLAEILANNDTIDANLLSKELDISHTKAAYFISILYRKGILEDK